MPISDYLARLRHRVGHDLLLVPGAGAVIRDAAGGVLAQRRSDDGRWSLPAGSCDPGEPPALTVVREVREETGLLVRPTGVLAVVGGLAWRHTYPNGDRLEANVTFFACDVVGGRLAPLDGESVELRYLPPADLPRLLPRYPIGLWSQAPQPVWYEWDEAWLARLATEGVDSRVEAKR